MSRAIDGNLENPLITAIRTSNLEEISRLAPENANITDENGRTPLHLAALLANLEAVKILLKSGANPNAKTTKGNTPMHVAAIAIAENHNTDAYKEETRQFKLKDIAWELLQAGANANTKNTGGLSPIDIATKNSGKVKMIDEESILLTRHDDKKEYLLYSDKLIEELLESTVEFSQHLINFVEENDIKRLTKELENDSEKEYIKASVNTSNESGITPLWFAASKGNEKAVDLLLKAGANPKEKCKGSTVSEIATINHHTATVKKLKDFIGEEKSLASTPAPAGFGDFAAGRGESSTDGPEAGAGMVVNPAYRGRNAGAADPSAAAGSAPMTANPGFAARGAKQTMRKPASAVPRGSVAAEGPVQRLKGEEFRDRSGTDC